VTLNFSADNSEQFLLNMGVKMVIKSETMDKKVMYFNHDWLLQAPVGTSMF
jgi:hypothetical protein